MTSFVNTLNDGPQGHGSSSACIHIGVSRLDSRLVSPRAAARDVHGTDMWVRSRREVLARTTSFRPISTSFRTCFPVEVTVRLRLKTDRLS